jgi:hypothetical protein
MFNSGSDLEDPDTRGIMTFNEGETGVWEDDNGSTSWLRKRMAPLK